MQGKTTQKILLCFYLV